MADEASDEDDLADGISQPAMDGALRDYAAWFTDAKAPALPARLLACLDAAIAAARLDDAAAQGAMAVQATLNFLMCLAQTASGCCSMPWPIILRSSNKAGRHRADQNPARAYLRQTAPADCPGLHQAATRAEADKRRRILLVKRVSSYSRDAEIRLRFK